MKLGERDQRGMDQKHKLGGEGTLYVSDMLKQKIAAGGIKIKRYDERCLQFHQNTSFRTNQRLFYNELNGVKHGMAGIPDPTASTELLNKIWLDDIVHNEGTSWLGDVEQELSGKPRQNEVKITVLDVKTVVRKMPNWKAPGPDFVQGFWFKKLTRLHTRLKYHLQDCLNQGNVPKWMGRGRTVLVMKNPQKGTQVTNYRS